MKVANVGTGVPNFDVHTILKYIVLAHETQSTKTTCAIFTYFQVIRKLILIIMTKSKCPEWREEAGGRACAEL